MISKEWNNKRTIFLKETNKAGKIHYSGVYHYNDIEFKFNITEQNNGKNAYRGRVTVISPESGKVMQLSGKPRSTRIKQYKGNRSKADLDRPHCKECAVFTEIHTNKTDEDSIKLCIEKGAMRLFAKYALLLASSLRKATTPESITPSVAAQIYAPVFAHSRGKKVSEKTIQSIVRRVTKACSALPDKPMKDLTQQDVTKSFGENAISNSNQRLLRTFWEYLLDTHYCSGINPVPPGDSQKTSRRVRQARAANPAVLEFSACDTLFTNLSKVKPTGCDCGVALMLWGRVPPSDSLVWGDILFDDKNESLARIQIQKSDIAGATHNFTRPLFPQAALILRKRYHQLLGRYNKEQLRTMPIISQEKNPVKAMKRNHVLQHAEKLLREVGVTEETFHCWRKPKSAVSELILFGTYDSLLANRCGLANDPATIRFLQGRRLDDVTSDHYTSFTEPAAVQRMHIAQLAVQPRVAITEPPATTENGCSTTYYSPSDTRSKVSATIELRIPPGARISSIHCPNGASVSTEVRRMQNGTIKRKSKRMKPGTNPLSDPRQGEHDPPLAPANGAEHTN